MLLAQRVGVPIEEIASMALPQEFVPRGSVPAVPEDYATLLNKQQQLALHTMQYFGWTLWFIRRAEQPVVVVINEALSGQYAVLESDGAINMDPAIRLRH